MTRTCVLKLFHEETREASIDNVRSTLTSFDPNTFCARGMYAADALRDLARTSRMTDPSSETIPPRCLYKTHC